MHQLDIFADSIPVQRANALLAALSQFDRTASKQALQDLVTADPAHTRLPDFETLCAFVYHRPENYNDPNWSCTPTSVAATEKLIRERIMPAATIMNDAGAWVRKIWVDLAQASEAAGIDSGYCDCFAAELYLRARQYHDVVRTAQGVPGAAMHAAVQRWLGLGCYGCGMVEQAGRAVLRYAWLSPQRFDPFVEEIHDVVLTRDWRNFQADLGDLDASWFPAWYAHEKKADTLLLDDLPTGDGATAYRLIAGLSIRERGGLCPALYEDRARLKRLSPSFFEFYMKHRTDLHTRRR